MAVDLNLVRHALTVARNAEFASVELEGPNLSFTAELGRAPKMQAAVVEPDEPVRADAGVVKCPQVGYFGVGPAPLKVGDRIAVGAVVGVVTALGIPNEVLSDVQGTVDQLLAKDGDPVEFGQPLIRVTAE